MRKILFQLVLLIIAISLTAGQSSVDSRLQVLKSTLDTKKETGIKDVLKALNGTDSEYRRGVLLLMSGYADEDIYVRIAKTMLKAKPAAKMDILNWYASEATDPAKRMLLKDLEVRFDLPVRQAFINQLSDKDKDVKRGAVLALSSIGDPKSLPSIARMLMDENQEIVLIARDGLVQFDADVAQAVSRAIPNATDFGKITGLEILASHKATNYVRVVTEQIRNGSPEVRQAAYETLEHVVTFREFTMVCGLLEDSTDENAVSPLQKAVIASVSSQPADEQLSLIQRRIIQAGDSKKHLYEVVLKALGN